MPQTPQPPQPYTPADSSSLSPPDPIASLMGALRGHYEFERELGQGAFATVYLARDLKHERKVAIKVLRVDPNSEMGEMRFVREIRMLARLQHPNILPLHDSGHVENLLYYVMPYVSGETLRDRLRAERQLPWETACNIAREVADALAYAHGQGIIHRDIKPENILLSAGHPMLADFGIARAIDVAGVKQLTRTGMGSPGTPAYMSPEQLLGVGEIDARSDTYSLGCVFFEMLAGALPFPGEEGLVNRFSDRVPSLTSIRGDLPKGVDRIVDTALARAPGDRFQTAEEFGVALDETKTPSGGGRTRAFSSQPIFARAPNSGWKAGLSYTRSALRNRRLLAVVVGVIAVALSIAAITANRYSTAFRLSSADSSIDSTKIVLLPLAGAASQNERTFVARRFYGALGDWRELRLPNSEDVQRAGGTVPASTEDAVALARKLGAGLLVWGQVAADDSTALQLNVFDISTGGLRTVATNANDTVAFASSLRQLLEVPGRPAAADGGDGRTHSFPAWRVYGAAHLALAKGDFDAARKGFSYAAQIDPDFAPARVWLAQTLAWVEPTARQSFGNQIVQATRARSGMSESDARVAQGLAALAERRYPDACGIYASMVSTDSLDFVGVYGSGQCRAFDSTVVTSPVSPTHWAFRSSYSAAAAYYARALSINPNAHRIVPFELMQELLPTASTKTRRGRNGAGEEFAAFPSLVHDSVIFTPYPLAQFAKLSARQTASQQSAAIARNLDELLDFVTDWTRTAPRSAPAFQALADVLEARGEITRSRSGGPSAVEAVETARHLSVDSHERTLAATAAAWLLFKEGEFTGARGLADSILADPSPPSDAGTVIGLAALTGKLQRTSELARETAPYAAAVSDLPLPVVDAAAPFFVFAALGVCSDTTARLEQRLNEQVAHNVAEERQASVLAALEARPLSMLGECPQTRARLLTLTSGARVLLLYQGLVRGDTAGVRKSLVSLTSDARAQRPGDISLDFAYQIAQLKMSVGEADAAASQLDRTLGGLPSAPAASLREPASAAAAVRAMALRAEIGLARGEPQSRRWAQAVVDLWATADAPLQPLVNRMRQIAEGRISR